MNTKLVMTALTTGLSFLIAPAIVYVIFGAVFAVIFFTHPPKVEGVVQNS